MLCPNKERGSVLFIILIAVALFAALSYIVAGDGGGSTGTQILETRAVTMADDVILFASSIEKTVSRMIQRGVSENDLCFDYDKGATTGYEHTGCNDDKNRVFNPAGGGLLWRDTQPEVFDSFHSAQPFYGDWFISGGTRVDGIGGDIQEIVLFLGYLNVHTCKAINRKFNIDLISDEIPQDDVNAVSYVAGSQFDGNFSPNFELADAADSFLGKKAGCFRSGSNPAPSGSYHFYYVVKPR